MKITINVPDMNCNHCKMTIENRLRSLPQVQQVTVDLERKCVKVNGNLEAEYVISAIEQAGYTPQDVEISQ